MKGIIKILIISLVIAILLVPLLTVPSMAAKPVKKNVPVISVQSVQASIAGSPEQRFDLVAGGGSLNGAMDVGDVYITSDGTNIHVKFQITDYRFYLATTQVKVSMESLAGTSSAPGQFPYKYPHGYVKEYEYVIPIPAGANNGDTIYIAAHADAVIPGAEEYIAGNVLPSRAELSVWRSSDPYYPVYLLAGIHEWVGSGSVLDGTYNPPLYYGAWCIDADSLINTYPARYWANVYSSYDVANVDPLVEYYENMDLVNWIINQPSFVNTDATDSSGSSLGKYTYGDVQVAIWMLLDDQLPADLRSVPGYSIDRANRIVELAQAGEGFVPVAGQKLAVVLDPYDPEGQPCIIWLTLPKGQDETAWGAEATWDPVTGKCTSLNYPFNAGKTGNWATFMEYTL
ncbi:MAG: hypothetical protein NC238_16080 [Dehalobacter sp.]|nr:hypothetical protein [Dehalobacter sp.]